MKKALRPEDILKDGVDFMVINGVKVRKASVAAMVANIKILEDAATSPFEKLQALKIINELFPSWDALELDKYLTFNNHEIQSLFEKFKKETIYENN